MSSRISDVKSKFYLSDEGHSANDRVQLSGLPTPVCWLRGVQYVLPDTTSAVSPGFRFDFVTSSDGSGMPDEADILFSFPAPILWGSQNFFFPDDSYFEIEDSNLYVTSSQAYALNSYSVTLFYT